MSIMNTLFGGSESSATNNSGSLSAGNNQSFSNGMNINYGTNSSGNSSSSSSSQGVWGQQSPFLQDVYGQGQDAFNNTMGQVNQLTPGVQDQMQQAQMAGMGGFQNQLAGGNIAAMQGQVGQNNYLDSVKGMVADDANLLKQQNLGALDARAAAAGMSGSSGYRNQVSDMMDNVDDNAQGQMAQLGYNSFNQGIQNQMQVANAMDANVNQGVGNMQNMQQGAMNQFNPAMMGQQVAANYAGTVGGPTTLSSSSSSGSGFSNGMNVGLGMNQGMGFGSNYGSSVGSGASNTSTQTGIVPGLAAAKAAGF
jgi:hypothetical protein